MRISDWSSDVCSSDLLAGHYAAFSRGRARLEAARKEIATCAISGAVGTFANIDPFVEDYVAKKLGLAPEPVSTQVIPRDRHAAFFATLALFASQVETPANRFPPPPPTPGAEAGGTFRLGRKDSRADPPK